MARVFRYAGRDWPDPRRTATWQRLVQQVAREEPTCWLRLPCCTTVSTTADHIEPVSKRPDLGLDRSNLRGACKPCNDARGNKPITALADLRRPRPAALSLFD